MKQLFLAWVPFQRRSITMQVYFKYQLVFLGFSQRFKYLRIVEYFIKSIQTLWLIVSQRPNVVWIQLPPNILLHLLIPIKLFCKNKFVLVADCHNATFRKPWLNIPGTVSFLRKCDILIVHNSEVQEQALMLCIPPEKVLILEDPPATFNLVSSACKYSYSHPLVIFPCSFNSDEPINEVLEAAKLTPDITFVLTGNFQRGRGIHDLSIAPSNVKLPGFLSEQDFNQLLFDADLIIGLTKLDGIQLSVASEAIGLGKPLLLSDTKLLRSLFSCGAVFVDSLDPDAIAKGCRLALEQSEILAEEILRLKGERKRDWKNKAEKVYTLLDNILES